ncbi:ig-like domain (group 1) [Caudoviricetes sp.]|nr:ig-like domain (group 1) [Caudoviricetes sp.]
MASLAKTLAKTLAKLLGKLLSFGSVLSASLSTLSVTPFAFDADGVTEAAIAGTIYDADGATVGSDSFTVTVTARTLSAADSTVAASPSTIADDNTDSSTITVRLVATSTGRPLRGVPAARVVLSLSSGTGTLTQPTGTTNYDGVITGSLVSNAAGTCVVLATVTLTGATPITQTASVTVSGTPAPPTLEMDSLWDFTTGASDPAIEDNSAWDPANTSNNTGTREGLLVAVASGTDPFVTNALEVRYRTASDGFAFLRKTGLAVPAVGQSKYYRWGYRHRYTQNQVANTPHPFQDGAAQGQTNWMFMIPPTTVTATTWRPRIQAADSVRVPANASRYQYLGPVLDIGTWYLFELEIARTGTDTFLMHMRVRNTAGTLIHGDSAFVNEANGAQSLADELTLTFYNVNNLDGINAGNNGITVGSSPILDEGPLFDQACLAVSNDNYIGAP